MRIAIQRAQDRRRVRLFRAARVSALSASRRTIGESSASTTWSTRLPVGRDRRTRSATAVRASGAARVATTRMATAADLRIGIVRRGLEQIGIRRTREHGDSSARTPDAPRRLRDHRCPARPAVASTADRLVAGAAAGAAMQPRSASGALGDAGTIGHRFTCSRGHHRATRVRRIAACVALVYGGRPRRFADRRPHVGSSSTFIQRDRRVVTIEIERARRRGRLAGSRFHPARPDR